MGDRLFRRRLGEMLLEDGVIDGDGIIHALEYAERTGTPLGRSLLALGLLDRPSLAVYLERQLGESLIERGLMNQVQVEDAFKRSQKAGVSFGRIIGRLGFVRDEELAQIVAEDYDLPCLHLRHLKIDEDVPRLMSREKALKTLFLPIVKDGDVLTVATSRPYDELTVSELEAITGLKVALLVVPERELVVAIRRYVP